MREETRQWLSDCIKQDINRIDSKNDKMTKTLTIGVCIGNANSPHTMNLMRGISHAAEELGVNVLFFLGVHSSYYFKSHFGEDDRDNFDYQFNVVYDYAWLGKVDAIIISYGSLCIFLEENDKSEFLKRFSGIPYVIIEERDESRNGSSIISDNYNGMYSVVEHLIKKHHCKRFTFLAGPEGNTDATERKTAFLDALRNEGIPFSDKYIQYGDYSECVVHQVNALLDARPDTDAMVCANDVMADTAYKECAKRGLVVGKNLAITGYDDWIMAESMTPPLTTVQQNSYDMGFLALRKAIDAYNGKQPVQFISPAILKIRESCGCKDRLIQRFPKPAGDSEQELKIYIDELTDLLSNHVIRSTVNDDSFREVWGHLRDVIEEGVYIYIDSEKGEKKLFVERVNHLISGFGGTAISPNTLTTVLNELVRDTIKDETQSYRIYTASEMLRQIQKTVQASEIKKGRDQLAQYQQDTWLIPLISKDMMNHIENEESFFYAAMQKLSSMKSKNAYLYILERPIIHSRNTEWECPQKMYLASCHIGSRVISYQPSERPVITKKRGFVQRSGRKDQFTMSVFPIFSGETQYGILIAEITPDDMPLIYLATVQIGIALSFFELNRSHLKTKNELEKLVGEVKEKNEILGFISENDVLTDCLNRRGFMEKALKRCKEYQGKKAILFFGDLDHLKEINDSFGHNEGDFAIQNSVILLKEALPRESLVGRIGGDEFVALFVGQNEISASDIVIRLKENTRDFNQNCEKPYYVEMSLGFHEFICTEDTSLAPMIENADRLLYDAKKSRRKSIKK